MQISFMTTTPRPAVRFGSSVPEVNSQIFDAEVVNAEVPALVHIPAKAKADSHVAALLGMTREALMRVPGR